jgi:hypothetical protein
VVIDSFENGCLLLEVLGCVEKSYQENKREKWSLLGVDITIDKWPYLPVVVEIESTNKESVGEIVRNLSLDMNEAMFGATDELIKKIYDVPADVINNKTPRITFDDPNPWVDWHKRI